MSEYRASPFLTHFSPLAGFGFLALGGLAAAAYYYDQDPAGLLFFPPLTLIGLYWLFAAASAPHTVLFEPDRLVIRRWLGTLTIAHADIHAFRQTYRLIILQTANGPLRLHKLNANDDALLVRMLEKNIPALRAERARRLQTNLPVVLKPGPSGALAVSLGGVVITVTGVLLIWAWLGGVVALEPGDRIFMPLFGFACLILGLFFLALVLRKFVYRTEFTRTQMTQFTLAGTRQQSMDGLTRIEKDYVVRTYRGLPRRIFRLVFHYQNRDPIAWIPDEFGADFSYIEAAAENQVDALAEMLRFAYLTHSQAAEAQE